MPAVFDNLGIRFQYPENWTLETDDPGEGRQTVSVYSPGGAFWSVTLDRRGDDPAPLARTALAVFETEYEELESEQAVEEIAGVDLQGYDLSFYYLDLTNTAWIRAGRIDGGTCLIICQGEDREFDQMADVFRAMTASLLSNRRR